MKSRSFAATQKHRRLKKGSIHVGVVFWSLNSHICRHIFPKTHQTSIQQVSWLTDHYSSAPSQTDEPIAMIIHTKDRLCSMGSSQKNSPHTVAGPFRLLTWFPIILRLHKVICTDIGTELIFLILLSVTNLSSVPVNVNPCDKNRYSFFASRHNNNTIYGLSETDQSGPHTQDFQVSVTCSMSSSVNAADKNIASNCDGAV